MSHKDNLKELWGILKEALHQKVSYKRSTPLHINDKLVEGPLIIAITFGINLKWFVLLSWSKKTILFLAYMHVLYQIFNDSYQLY